MKMLQINKSILFVFLMCCGLNSQAQTIEKCFVNLPDRLNPTMTRQIRTELLEYSKAGKGDSIQNRFGNVAYLQTFDTLNNRIVLKTTESTVFEMKLLKVDNGKLVVGIIHSVCAPICQSTVEFYDTTWTKIPLQFNMPKAIRWVNDEKLANVANLDTVWVKRVLENSFVTLHFDANNPWVIANNNSADFLSDRDRKDIFPILDTQPVVFQLIDSVWVEKP